MLVTHTLPLSEWLQRPVTITGIDIFDMDCNLYIYILENEDDEDKIEITVNSNVFPHIHWTSINGGTINLMYDKVSFMHRKPNLTISLFVKNLRDVGLHGASTAHINGVVISDNLRIHLRGASELRVHGEGRIEANHISAVLSGASKMNLSGQCEMLDITLSGASQAYGFGMVCEDLDAKLSGASKAEYTVLNTLSATLSGSSVLRYDGNPTIIYSNISGSSRLEKR